MKKYLPWIAVALSALLLVGVVLLLVPATNEEPPHTHNWQNATCVKPKTCRDCGATEGEAAMHNWQEATCIRPKTCKDCRATEGEVIAHNWQDATCTKPETCEGCGATAGEAKGHTWKNGECTQCGAPKPSEGLSFTLGDRNYYIVSGIGSCKDTHIIIPDVYKGFPVTAIGEKAFDGCKTLTQVTIPDSITSIGAWAFQLCDSLVNITIPGSVQSIGLRAFSNCDSLTSITIPEGVITIDNSAFDACSNLKNITIPASVTDFGDRSPFYGCPKLTGIWVNENNPAYSSDEKGVLFNKDKTELIKMPCGFKGAYAIPSGVKSFSGAFQSCKSLTSITIPDGVTTIGETEFADCQSLVSITLPDSVTSIGSFAFYDCRSLESIIIPQGLKILSSSAFGYCYSLKSVTIPDGVTNIHDRVFESCTGLESVTIPHSVTEIYYYAFDNCKKLTSITYTGTTAQWQNIKLWYDWNLDVPATKVICSDGTVSLTK